MFQVTQLQVDGWIDQLFKRANKINEDDSLSETEKMDQTLEIWRGIGDLMFTVNNDPKARRQWQEMVSRLEGEMTRMRERTLS